MKKTSLKLMLIALLIVLFPLSANAFVVKSDDVVKVGQDEIIEGNLYAAASSITINGTVKGDLICAAQTININGPIEGDIICAGQTININSYVGGNIRVAGNTININSKVGRNVMAFGNVVHFGSGADVGWSAMVAGANVNVMGKVGGTLHGGGENVTVDAEVAKSVDFDAKTLVIGDNAKIGADLNYVEYNKGEVEVSDKAVIAGKINPREKKIAGKQKSIIWGISLAWIWGKIISIFSVLILGLVFISLFKDKVENTVKKMIDKPWAQIGWGLVILIITPVIALILAITIIGLPLAAILIFAWLIMLFIAKAMAAIAFGFWLFDKFKKKTKTLMWPMIAGIIISYIIFCIPFIGWILALAALLWGLGGLWSCCKKYY